MPVELYTVDQAAQRLNTAPRFIRRLITERRIAFTRVRASSGKRTFASSSKRSTVARPVIPE